MIKGGKLVIKIIEKKINKINNTDYGLVVELLAARHGQGRLQAEHHQLLGADERQPDTEHHHVEARQATQGCLRSAARQEGRESFSFVLALIINIKAILCINEKQNNNKKSW